MAIEQHILEAPVEHPVFQMPSTHKADPPPHVVIDHLQKSFNDVAVLRGISLKVERGEFVALVGKSGCGKSTLLRHIAGLDKSSGGQVLISGEKLEGLNKESRVMFQEDRLLPWKKVRENVGLGLKGDWRPVANQALEEVGLLPRANEWPEILSGGQKQRVALARALVHRPELLLLDEPLGALDALTRISMQRLIERIWHEHQFTIILITHDVEEAIALADRVIVMEEGVVGLDLTISLPRPRKRGNAEFAALTSQVLDRVLGSDFD